MISFKCELSKLLGDEMIWIFLKHSLYHKWYHIFWNTFWKCKKCTCVRVRACVRAHAHDCVFVATATTISSSKTPFFPALFPGKSSSEDVFLLCLVRHLLLTIFTFCIPGVSASFPASPSIAPVFPPPQLPLPPRTDSTAMSKYSFSHTLPAFIPFFNWIFWYSCRSRYMRTLWKLFQWNRFFFNRPQQCWDWQKDQ